jgi:hypothetical protein
MPFIQTKSLRERLYEKVNKNGPIPAHRPELGPCHIYTGFKQHFGYGYIKVNGKNKPVHVVVYELEHGPVPAGKKVLHHCDNPPCCRDSHLFSGTQKENVQDCIAKGRRVQHGSKGEAHWGAKLTWALVQEMRRRGAEGEKSPALAVAFGMSARNVRRILRGDTWPVAPAS